jgi:hypothetical protein
MSFAPDFLDRPLAVPRCLSHRYRNPWPAFPLPAEALLAGMLPRHGTKIKTAGGTLQARSVLVGAELFQIELGCSTSSPSVQLQDSVLGIAMAT